NGLRDCALFPSGEWTGSPGALEAKSREYPKQCGANESSATARSKLGARRSHEDAALPFGFRGGRTGAAAAPAAALPDTREDRAICGGPRVDSRAPGIFPRAEVQSQKAPTPRWWRRIRMRAAQRRNAPVLPQAREKPRSCGMARRYRGKSCLREVPERIASQI